MIVVTADTIQGKVVTRTLGLARGNTIRTRHLGKDILAGLRNLVGGEVSEYTTRERRVECRSDQRWHRPNAPSQSRQSP